MGDNDDKSLKKELETCQNVLVDSERKQWETQCVHFCHRYSGPKKSVPKDRCCFRQSQLCNLAEVTIHFCAQKRKRRELQLLLCTRK